jgi:hypothetical protein
MTDEQQPDPDDVQRGAWNPRIRCLSQEEAPEGVRPLWQGDSFFVWDTQTGELWEACISKPFYRQIPGVFKYESRDLVVDEI